jgi:hypothetical protein
MYCGLACIGVSSMLQFPTPIVSYLAVLARMSAVSEDTGRPVTECGKSE